MSRLPKGYADLVKRGQRWQCKKCGKSIKSGGHIHHKDGNPANNKITNLVALCRKCHQQVKRKTKVPWWEK